MNERQISFIIWEKSSTQIKGQLDKRAVNFSIGFKCLLFPHSGLKTYQYTPVCVCFDRCTLEKANNTTTAHGKRLTNVTHNIEWGWRQQMCLNCLYTDLGCDEKGTIACWCKNHFITHKHNMLHLEGFCAVFWTLYINCLVAEI